MLGNEAKMKVVSLIRFGPSSFFGKYDSALREERMLEWVVLYTL